MNLTWGAAGAVLFAALLHASWNAMVKSSTDKQLDTALIHLLGSVLGVPLLLVVGMPPVEAWPYIGVSVVIHVVYYIALTGAYQHGDLGLTYPLMRGVGPVLVALSATFTVGEHFSPLAWAGVLGVCTGTLVLGLSPRALQQPRAVAFALANAVVIAVYTVVDALGARSAVQAGGSAVQYVALLLVVDGSPFALMVLRKRGLAAAALYTRARMPVATAGAAASLSSYGIALWAMTLAPVATIAALRETSVLFAALLGTWFLKEAFTTRRMLGTASIVAGVMALRLG